MHDDPLVAWRSAFDALLKLGVVDMEGKRATLGQHGRCRHLRRHRACQHGSGAARLADVLESLCFQEPELLVRIR